MAAVCQRGEQQQAGPLQEEDETASKTASKAQRMNISRKDVVI